MYACKTWTLTTKQGEAERKKVHVPFQVLDFLLLNYMYNVWNDSLNLKACVIYSMPTVIC